MDGPTVISELDFYARALQLNEAGNNHSRAHNRPQHHNWSFQPPGGPTPEPACSLSNPDHRGQVALYVYQDSRNMKHYQHFCEGHRGKRWQVADPDEWKMWYRRRSRHVEPKPAPAGPQPRRRA